MNPIVRITAVYLATLGLALPAAQAAPSGRPDVVVADFEGSTYGKWRAEGTAFGTGPAPGTLPNQMTVSGYQGHGLVDSFSGGDAATGVLVSPRFTLTRRYLNFLIGGGRHSGATEIELFVGGKLVRRATGPNAAPGGSERLDWATWDLRGLLGKSAHLAIVDRATGGWGHISVDQITLSDRAETEVEGTARLYEEAYRPQFHFTAKMGWLNDPNGLVFLDGEYHLFYQFEALLSGEDPRKSWGHAVSSDLIHWQQMDEALKPEALGPIWSGSSVVDWHNTSGLGQPGTPPLIALYTAAGGESPESSGRMFTQCLAYSQDRGRTWKRYAHNPIVGNVAPGNRDPKVVWYAPTRRWIMALYLDGDRFGLFSSPDLKTWTQTQTLTLPGSSECPDFFEMPVEGTTERRWVFTAADDHYEVGTFDGTTFTPQTPPLAGDAGASFYAAQTFSDIPAADGRRIQISWMRGGVYPSMPFNQQMSFPCTLTLHDTPTGPCLFRWPVREISTLYAATTHQQNVMVTPGAAHPVTTLSGDLWDVEATFAPGADVTAFGLRLRGADIRYDVSGGTLSCLGRQTPLALSSGKVTLRFLLDHTSLEVFGGGGAASLSSCFLPARGDSDLSMYAEGGAVTLVSLTTHKLHSAWKPK